MIRDFKTTDVNQCIDLAYDHAAEAGGGIGKLNRDKLIEFVKKVNIMDGYKVFISERGGEIDGYVVCYAFENPWTGVTEGMVTMLYVTPSKRQGFTAKDLLVAAEQWFRDCDCEFFCASVRAFNSDYSANKEFIDNGDNFFNRMMTPCGHHYIKEIL
jgi:hypothetical protein